MEGTTQRLTMDGKPLPDGVIEDAEGKLLLKQSVKTIDIMRDELVYSIVESAKELQTMMRQFYDKALSETSYFVELSQEKHGVKYKENQGNFSFFSYNGKYKVQIAIAKRISFNELLKAAKTLIDEYLVELTHDANSDLKTVVKEAFKIDDKGGVNTKDILDLRKYNIKHEKWRKAMELISDSIFVVTQKKTLRIYERPSRDEKLRQISLNMSALPKEEKHERTKSDDIV